MQCYAEKKWQKMTIFHLCELYSFALFMTFFAFKLLDPTNFKTFQLGLIRSSTQLWSRIVGTYNKN